MLIEDTLFGRVDKVVEAIKLLREYEPPEGYYVAFSGGKDSVVALDLVKRAGVKYDAHYALTTVDPPELIYFIREHYPEAWEARERPKTTMWQLIEKNKILPTRRIRYCCREFKEHNGDGRDVITGVRAAESPRRAKRNKREKKYLDKGHWFLHIIFDWSTAEVWEYIKSNGLPYCRLYDEDRDRIGCIMCPFQNGNKIPKDIARWPKYAELYRLAANRAYDASMKAGKTYKVFKNGDDMYNWWVTSQKYPEVAESCDAVPLFSEDDGEGVL